MLSLNGYPLRIAGFAYLTLLLLVLVGAEKDGAGVDNSLSKRYEYTDSQYRLYTTALKLALGSQFVLCGAHAASSNPTLGIGCAISGGFVTASCVSVTWRVLFT